MPMSDTTIQKAIDATRKLASLRARQAELTDQLARALKLKQLWPEVFDHGAAKVGGSSNAHDVHLGTIRVTDGAGTVREFPAMKVPFDLWPKTMQVDFRAMPAAKRQKIEDRLIP